MNEKQRIILIVVVPVLIIVLALGLASDKGGDWDNWGVTWPVWAVAVTAIAVFEWFMFRR